MTPTAHHPLHPRLPRPGLRWLLPALLCLGGAPLPAQGPGWDIPPRGAIVFDRTTQEFGFQGPPSRLRPEWVIADGRSPEAQRWRYFACPKAAVPAGFEAVAFDDAGWAFGPGEFGPDVGKAANQNSPWASEALCLRTRLVLPKKPKALWFQVQHDDGVRLWLNGKLLVADDGYGRDRSYVVTGAALDAWQAGDNVLAALCTNVGGAQYFDLRMATVATLPPGVKTAEDLQRVLREDAELGSRVRADLIGGFRPPPLLLQGELDPRQQFVRIPPGDLRDLGWWLAVDLRCGVLGGAVTADASRLFRLGDIAVKGKASAVDAEGWQQLELTLKSPADLQPRGESKRFLDRHVRPFIAYGIDGTLEVRRRLDVRNGKVRVVEFTTTMLASIVRGKDGKEIAATVRQRESWRLRDVPENQDAAFRAMVAAALQRGTARLREQLQNLGANELKAQPADGGDSYHSGRLAIGLLALVKGGVPVTDDVVQKGYAELRKRTLIDTYSLANAIMAIEALYTPSGESGDLRSGTIQRAHKREPSPEDKALLQQWAARLLDNIDTRVDPQYLLRFNYTRGARFDNSVNQYGLLGLYSAHLCGVDIPANTWEAAANHLLTAQSGFGDKLDLTLLDYRTLAARMADPDAPFTQSKSSNRALGWSYEEPKRDGEWTPTWGSMTCAGITGLTICQAGLLDNPDLKRGRLLGNIVRARDDGFAWLAQWMTARSNPGAIERQQHWIYYYLYGLERAALLSGVALIQDRDWYFEGAMVLVLAQQDDGHWPAELLWDLGIERNAMAILFLKQSTAPVVTGR